MRSRIGITLGDPAGIGPEIARAALDSPRLSREADYEIIGTYPECQPGQPSAESARAAGAALEEAAERLLNGSIRAIVTGPIHKARMYEIGFEFPGQTEFFASRCKIDNFAMLLTGGKITVALVTAHLPLRDVADALKESEIVRVGLLLADFLRRRGRKTPKIAVAGLNPHAGESGKLGLEEEKIIGPAIAKLNRDTHSVFDGPVPPDTLFHHLAVGKWDAALCMYHDQGLIPLKLHAFHEGVNVTLGLPFPRTSPDHGTAFDIAGKGIAKADSMIAAINLAVELARKGEEA